jgi:hypothetical protein
VRSDQLEQIVWDQVRALLEEPHRVADEYRGRMARTRDGAAMPDEILRLDRQIATLRRGIGRLIDSYTESVIDKAEFEPRITGLKQRMSQLQERYQEARDAAEVERNLSLPPSQGSSQEDCGEEDIGPLVIAGCDAAEVLKAAEHPLDDIASLVSGFVVAVRCLRVGFGGMTALIRRLASTSLRLLAS